MHICKIMKIMPYGVFFVDFFFRKCSNFTWTLTFIWTYTQIWCKSLGMGARNKYEVETKFWLELKNPIELKRKQFSSVMFILIVKLGSVSNLIKKVFGNNSTTFKSYPRKIPTKHSTWTVHWILQICKVGNPELQMVYFVQYTLIRQFFVVKCKSTLQVFPATLAHWQCARRLPKANACGCFLGFGDVCECFYFFTSMGGKFSEQKPKNIHTIPFGSLPVF